MADPLSKSQIDRLGERLKKGETGEEDLRLLDRYRRSFRDGYDHVVGKIREHLDLAPTGRPAKTRAALRDKLQRESIRLSQVQDIAGCRIIVRIIADQDSAVAELLRLFPEATVMDRRENPSHGYRAVHVIPRVEGKLVEIQVRTYLQDLWAQLSEKLADAFDPALKYGGGDEPLRRFLVATSDQVAAFEEYERAVAEVRTKTEEFERAVGRLEARIEERPDLQAGLEPKSTQWRRRLVEARRHHAGREKEFQEEFRQLVDTLREAIKSLDQEDG